jgi:Histidine kinase-, DNA gyrase B-, and HSP90-like ATPase
MLSGHIESMSEQELPPSAKASVESLRAFDYGLPSALADLIDNSITAGAKNVDIKVLWSGATSSLAVSDDGLGMTEEELVNAMRFGSKSPKEKRAEKDLGRFGLGLKTASIWACRRVTVITKAKDSPVVSWRWDVDVISERDRWILSRGEGQLISALCDVLQTQASGTIVVWEKMDTLLSGGIDGNTKSEDSFNASFSEALNHLGMVFHRFIEKGIVSIGVGRVKVVPWNPLSSQPVPELVRADSFTYKGEVIKITCGIMPHPKRLSQQVAETVGGPSGWYAQQGFYVYRRDRIIVAGGWLGMLRPADHYKLARIAVEVPNALDLDLGVSVTKTNISLPDGIKDRLKTAAEALRQRAFTIYRHRGRKALASTVEGDIEFAWTKMQRVDGGLTYFLVNKQHYLYKRVRESVRDKKALELLMDLLEQTLPTADIGLANSNKPDSVAGAFEGDTDEERLNKFREAFTVYRSKCDDDVEAKNMLQKTYPFSHFPDIIAQI